MSWSTDPRLREYFAAQGVDPEGVCQADVVLALLRLGDREAAERALGRPIERCPPAVPPWPPRPAPRAPAAAQVSSVQLNPCIPTTDAWRRYRLVGLNMTEQQLLSRGVTRRDLTRWTRLGYIEWRTR